MVETTLTPVTATKAGTDITTSLVAPVVGGDNFVNDGTMFLLIVTLTNPTTISVIGQALAYNGSTINQSSGAISAGHSVVMGPFERSDFNDAANLCHFTSTENSTTRVAVISSTPKG
jgi:hypothetical protein